MNQIKTSALEVAQRYIGTKEFLGIKDNPVIMAMLDLDDDWPEHDEVPWCSSFANWVCWNLGLSRSGSKAARSWLKVGENVETHLADQGMDIVVFKRGNNPVQGHVGFFYEFKDGKVGVIGGNQGDAVSLAYFDRDDVLAVRRLVRG
jgi:uncharacterized protein (TIGR02594 family)